MIHLFLARRRIHKSQWIEMETKKQAFSMEMSMQFKGWIGQCLTAVPSVVISKFYQSFQMTIHEWFQCKFHKYSYCNSWPVTSERRTEESQSHILVGHSQWWPGADTRNMFSQSMSLCCVILCGSVSNNISDKMSTPIINHDLFFTFVNWIKFTQINK